MTAAARRVPAIAFVLFAGALTGYCLQFVFDLAGRFPAAAPALRVDACGIVVLGIALASLAPWARRMPPRSISLVAGALIGALLYLRSFGWAWLDPTAIDWLLHGDLAQHYTGWAFFRQEPWQWPPGAIDGLRHPLGTSVFFTDAHPLLALAFKPFAALLPQPFQYIGLTLLLNWMLMGAASAGVLRLAMRGEGDKGGDGGAAALLVQALAALLVVLSPVLSARIGHDTLTAQWLVVAALGLAFLRSQRHQAQTQATSRLLVGWCALVAIASLTHLYLLAMVLAVFAADRMQAVVFDRSCRLRTALRDGLCVLAVCLAALWLAGAFTVPGRQTLDFDNAGRWSANLFTFFDAHGASRLAPKLPRLVARPEQWEGWAYLGAGVLLAIVLAGIALIVRPRTRAVLRGGAALWLMGAVLFAFALGPVVSAGGMTLLESEWLQQLPLYSLFRSCGRFVWPLHYLLLLSALLVLARSGWRTAVPVLAAACLLQVVDLRIHDRQGERRVQPVPASAQPLSDRRWNDLAAGRRHLELVAGHGCGKEVAHWLAASELALRFHLSVNTGYVARIDGARWQRYCQAQSQLLAGGTRRFDTLYLVQDEQLPAFRAAASPPLRCTRIDALNACVVDTQPALR